jgi:hypothetical protein
VDADAALADGLIIGSVIALGAIGLTLTFSILRFANFGHGELLAWGAYSPLARWRCSRRGGGAHRSRRSPSAGRCWRTLARRRADRAAGAGAGLGCCSRGCGARARSRW